ncbi:uncharacterized protein LTR77_007133 [Saxophila tyrrhenica]|uniref:ER transporter 6TM N-terminal domain-containing protein n=1 Tax=Saxophila tyrrhenica TaxID=1690608 RepID=A0AAV9P6T5_9PEZI|nr:hypothetical protein LTR77_007133 [Saxophila tyrrhenica]
MSTNGQTAHTGSNGKIKTSPPDADSGRVPIFTRMLDKTKHLWTKSGITWPLYKSMFKGALAPTIAVAAFQANAYAQEFSTLGYLIGIMTILSLVIQPRAKFLQTMLIQLLLTCLVCAVTVLAFFCCVQARMGSEGTVGPGAGGSGTSGLASNGAATAQYSSSASAVAGVWLFTQIFFISVLRARMPQYTVPSIMAAVFVNVAMTYAPQFSTMTQAEQFALRLLEAYLTGFGIAAGTSLLVFPLTSRHLVFADMRASIAGFRGALGANLDYLKSLEDTDMFAAQRTRTDGVKPARSPEAEALIAKVQALGPTNAKFAIDLPFAKREVAIGKLGPDDLQELYRRVRECTIPLVGLSCMSDIFERTSEERGWDRSVSFATATFEDATNAAERARIENINQWHELIKLLKEPFTSITEAIGEGFEHCSRTLQLEKPPKQDKPKRDPEASAARVEPGDAAFGGAFRTKIEDFHKSKQLMLRGWCDIHGIELPQDYFTNPSAKEIQAPRWMSAGPLTEERRRLRRQLMVLLYVEFLLYLMAKRVHALILVADELRASGKLSHSRLIVPGFKRLRKWVRSSLFHSQEGHEEDTMDFNDHTTNVELGQAFKKRKDPEHLEPQTTWERLTDHLRAIPRFFGSPASHFGFRVAVAVMSLAIINYLHPTQVFFTEQRLFWAQIMTSIGMTPSSGQALRTFILRVIGTFMAMILALIAYYVVDGHVAGVLVFFFVFLHIGNYIILTRPKLIPIGIISQVTITLIIGYELQVRKIGVQAATSNGQAYYPIWQLGLIRLATVVGGLFLAYIFSIFPYPITEHSQLRKNLGSCLYLTANYYSVVHETVQVRLAGAEGDTTAKGSPGHQLEKNRQRIFAKCQALLGGLRTQSGFVKYDIPIGGKFPSELYTQITSDLQSVTNYISLISVASSAFAELQYDSNEMSGSEWLRNFRRIMGEAKLTSQTVTTLLALLSASVTSGNPLPPYVRLPEPYLLSERLDAIDTDILSVRHIAEPGYASFAVIQIGTKCLVDDLKKLLRGVKQLVGELDFSYHVVNTADQSRAGSREALFFNAPAGNDRSDGKME